MTKAKVQQLCTNYDVVIDDQIIDCKDLKLIKKTMKIDNSHHLNKRQAEPEVSLDEGSGNGKKIYVINKTMITLLLNKNLILVDIFN